jgi:hypothetical protein
MGEPEGLPAVRAPGRAPRHARPWRFTRQSRQ